VTSSVFLRVSSIIDPRLKSLRFPLTSQVISVELVPLTCHAIFGSFRSSISEAWGHRPNKRLPRKSDIWPEHPLSSRASALLGTALRLSFLPWSNPRASLNSLVCLHGSSNRSRQRLPRAVLGAIGTWTQYLRIYARGQHSTTLLIGSRMPRMSQLGTLHPRCLR
jgi:hypothetical protein